MVHGSSKETIILILLALVFVKLFFPRLISGFTRMNMSDISTTGTGKDPNMFWALKNELKCVPGPGADADYYQRSDNPGGVCGGQKFVADQMRNWKYADSSASPV
jgi:hypothetical protein